MRPCLSLCLIPAGHGIMAPPPPRAKQPDGAHVSEGACKSGTGGSTAGTDDGTLAALLGFG